MRKPYADHGGILYTDLYHIAHLFSIADKHKYADTYRDSNRDAADFDVFSNNNADSDNNIDIICDADQYIYRDVYSHQHIHSVAHNKYSVFNDVADAVASTHFQRTKDIKQDQ